MRKVLAGYKNGVDVNNDKRFITKWMKTWIAAKGGKSNILLQINQIAVFTPRLILRRFTEQNGVTSLQEWCF